MTQEEYYTNNGTNPQDSNWGSYQNVTLKDIVNNFQLMYVDDGDLLNTSIGIRFYFMQSVLFRNYNMMAIELLIHCNLMLVMT